MTKFNSAILHAGVALAALCGCASQANATDLYFQMNPNYTGGQGVRQAFVFGTAGATGTVSSQGGFNSAFTLNSQGFSTINLPLSYELANQTIQNNGFKISSASAISGYFLSRMPFTTDMSYLVDGSKLGTNYVTASYASASTGSEQISVQATVNNTSVTITPVGSAPIQVTLNAGQTYMYNRTASLTGSTVSASAPVAVFSGNSCSNIPSGNGFCDHIDEQMISVDQLSTSYLLGKTPRTGALGDVYRVVASEDGTTVTANGVVVATLNKGQFYEGRVTSGIDIESSKPVLVAQYLIGQTEAGANTDPAMTIVPGKDQWLNSYVFATPSGTADFPTDIISLILKTATMSSLTVGGVAANTAGFTAIGTTGYSFGNIDVSNTSGPFSITAADPFQLLLSGYDNADSYFTYGGARFSPGASPAPAVPEPATWGMMILGFGMIGAASRSRKVRTTVAYA